ncbi:MAG: hypothetical protein WBN81_13695 [Gammaproteobacteria bacterium]
MRIMLFIVVIVACGLGYGFWHSLTHAAFHVQLDFRDHDSGIQEIFPKVGIEFLDTEGRVLAQGVSDEHYNYVHLIHPEVGDCHEAEQSAPFSVEGNNAWETCFEHLSTWIATWAGKVSQVNVNTDRCTRRNLPVTVSVSNSDWFLWWVPHPHIGGNPYKYYSLSITVDEKDCSKQPMTPD